MEEGGRETDIVVKVEQLSVKICSVSAAAPYGRLGLRPGGRSLPLVTSPGSPRPLAVPPLRLSAERLRGSMKGASSHSQL